MRVQTLFQCLSFRSPPPLPKVKSWLPALSRLEQPSPLEKRIHVRRLRTEPAEYQRHLQYDRGEYRTSPVPELHFFDYAFIRSWQGWKGLSGRPQHSSWIIECWRFQIKRSAPDIPHNTNNRKSRALIGRSCQCMTEWVGVAPQFPRCSVAHNHRPTARTISVSEAAALQ